MKYGVRYKDGYWWVYEVAANKLISYHRHKALAKYASDKLNERGV